MQVLMTMFTSTVSTWMSQTPRVWGSPQPPYHLYVKKDVITLKLYAIQAIYTANEVKTSFYVLRLKILTAACRRRIFQGRVHIVDNI